MPAIPGPDSPLNMHEATAADRPRLVAHINLAFSIENFIEGSRTDDEQLAVMMERGRILMAEDAAGCLQASVYIELRGQRGYLGMLAVDPTHQGQGLARRTVEAAEERLRQQGCEAVDIWCSASALSCCLFTASSALLRLAHKSSNRHVRSSPGSSAMPS